jgi:prolyl oligopeptidase
VCFDTTTALLTIRMFDLLRFHLFTIGHAIRGEYGDPDVKDDFDFIYKWSPYHNVRNGNYQYPAILCETVDHDDYVYHSLLRLINA